MRWETTVEEFEFDLAIMEGVLIDYIKTQRAIRGDAFATESEMYNILSDPWAWCDLARPLFNAIFHTGGEVPADYDYDPVFHRGVLIVRFHKHHWVTES